MSFHFTTTTYSVVCLTELACTKNIIAELRPHLRSQSFKYRYRNHPQRTSCLLGETIRYFAPPAKRVFGEPCFCKSSPLPITNPRNPRQSMSHTKGKMRDPNHFFGSRSYDAAPT